MECFKHPALSENALKMYLNKYVFDSDYLIKNYEKLANRYFEIFSRKVETGGLFLLGRDLKIDWDHCTSDLDSVVNFSQLTEMMKINNLYVVIFPT